MAQNAEIFFEHDNWGRALAWSAGFHIAITAVILLYTAVFTGSRGQGWGAGSGWVGYAYFARRVPGVKRICEQIRRNERA